MEDRNSGGSLVARAPRFHRPAKLRRQEKYPSKPIKIIVPLGAAGGSHDLHARAVASVLHQYIGQPAFVQLMPGGGGKIGMGALKRAKPDGYTLLMGSNSQLYLSTHVKDMGIDPFKDFIPVFKINELPYLLVSLGNRPWKNFKEYIAAAKKSKGKIMHGSTGAYGLSHTMLLKIAYDTKTTLNHVPFRGGGPALDARHAGRTRANGGSQPGDGRRSLQLQVRQNTHSGRRRREAIQNVSGCPDSQGGGSRPSPAFEANRHGARGNAKDRIDILEKALLKMSKDKTFKRLLKKMGVRSQPVVGEQLLKELKAEYNSNKNIFKNAGVKIRN